MGLCGGSCASRWSRPLVPPPVSSTRGQCGQGAPWVLYPAHFTLQAPGRGRDNPPSRKAPCRVSGILVSGVVRLFPPWGFRGGVGEAEAGSVGLLSSPASSLLGTFSGFLFCQIDVVLSCSPGPGLSRVRRGTDVHGEWDRSSRSARGPLAPSPLPAVAVRWGVWGGVQAPARPRPPVFCLTALAGPGSPDAADTLACLPWLRVVRGPPRHGEGRPGAALLTRLGVLSALRVALRGAPGALQVVSGARNRAGSVVSRSQRPPPSGHRCRWRVRGAGGGVGKGGPPRPPPWDAGASSSPATSCAGGGGGLDFGVGRVSRLRRAEPAPWRLASRGAAAFLPGMPCLSPFVVASPEARGSRWSVT